MTETTHQHNAGQDPIVPVIYIDGECRLCDRAAGLILHHSQPEQFHFALLQDHPEKLPPGSSPDTLIVTWGNETYTRGEAILFLASRIPRYRIWGKIISYLPPSVIDMTYRLIARYRYRLWGKKECSLPGKKQNVD